MSADKPCHGRDSAACSGESLGADPRSGDGNHGPIWPARRVAPVGVALLLLLLAASAYRWQTRFTANHDGYDENVYCVLARTLGEGGVAGFRQLIRRWPDDEVLNKGPSPFRLFYIFWAVDICKARGAYTPANLVLLSQLFGFGTIVLGFLLLRQWCRPSVAMGAALLLVVSPLATASSARALQDTCFAFLVTASVFFYHRCWCYNKTRDFFFLGAALTAGFLTKESMLFVYPMLLLPALYYGRHYGWRRWWRFTLPLVLAPVIAAAVMIWMAGDIHSFLRTYTAYAQMPASIPYSQRYQQGPWFRYVVDFLLLSPVTLLLAVAGLATAPHCGDRQGRHLAALYLLVGLLVFSWLPLLNVRLVLFLDLFIRLLAAIAVFALVERVKTRAWRAALLACTILIVLCSDAWQYHRIFVKAKVYDPVTNELVVANGLVR